MYTTVANKQHLGRSRVLLQLLNTAAGDNRLVFEVRAAA
jgi:hypothetical protein